MLTVQHFEELQSLSQRLVAEVIVRLERAVVAHGVASLVLSGGKTPRLAYEMLADRQMDWSRVHFFWGDERWLPHDHADSNFSLAKKALLDHITVPTANLHPIPYEGKDIVKDAADYDRLLGNFLLGGNCDDRMDSARMHGLFDVTLLGMGEDGHVASLFPGYPLLQEKQRLAAELRDPIGNPPVPRITMTFASLRRSRCVMLLIGGAKKKDILDRILSGEEGLGYPASMVTAEEEVRWYVAG